MERSELNQLMIRVARDFAEGMAAHIGAEPPKDLHDAMQWSAIPVIGLCNAIAGLEVLRGCPRWGVVEVDDVVRPLVTVLENLYFAHYITTVGLLDLIQELREVVLTVSAEHTPALLEV